MRPAILAALLLCGAAYAGSKLAHNFSGYTTIPENEPQAGQHWIPVPPIHRIDFELAWIPVGDELQLYGIVTVNEGDTFETAYQVDSHKLTFVAR